MNMVLLRQLKSGYKKVIELPNGLAKTWRWSPTNNTFAKSYGFSIGLVWATVALSIIKMLEDSLEITDNQQ